MGSSNSKTQKPTSESKKPSINCSGMHSDSHTTSKSSVRVMEKVQISQTRRSTTTSIHSVTSQTIRSSGTGTSTSMPALTYTPVYKRPSLTISADASPVNLPTQTYRNSNYSTSGNPSAMHEYVYDLSKKAYVLVFHHHKFMENRYNREGSSKDMEKIKQTLKKYRCDKLDINENLTYRGVLKKMDNISSQDFSKHSCLIVFILSHGDVNDTIMAYDGCMYSFHNDIVEKCTENHTLKSKPKIFILQACRGDAKIVADTSRSMSNKIDIVAFQSSYQGAVSYRHEHKGSFFIQAFLRLLDENNQQNIININALLNREFEASGILQTPTLMTTLRKELIFGNLLLRS